jgi:hypothetical protein
LSSPSPIVSTNATSAYDPLNPTLKQARSGPDAAKWTQAIKEEEDVLFKKDTFRYVSLSVIPAEYRPIPTKFVLKIKISGKKGSIGGVWKFGQLGWRDLLSNFQQICHLAYLCANRYASPLRNHGGYYRSFCHGTNHPYSLRYHS